jgi:hypothetical protein
LEEARRSLTFDNTKKLKFLIQSYSVKKKGIFRPHNLIADKKFGVVEFHVQ